MQLYRIVLVLLAGWNHTQRCDKRDACVGRRAVCRLFFKLQLCRVNLGDWQGKLVRLAQAVITQPASIVRQADFYGCSFNAEPELRQQKANDQGDGNVVLRWNCLHEYSAQIHAG